jgi:hypothetical protein
MNSSVKKEKLACVVSRDEFNTLWKSSHKNNNHATLLVLEDDLRSARYLYTEGVIGLARAMMNSDSQKVREYMRLLFETAADDDVLELLKKDNPIEFAVKAILKFKPVVPIRTEELPEYKKVMEKYLIAA